MNIFSAYSLLRAQEYVKQWGLKSEHLEAHTLTEFECVLPEPCTRFLNVTSEKARNNLAECTGRAPVCVKVSRGGVQEEVNIIQASCG